MLFCRVGHPDVDALLKNGTKLPTSHPTVSPYMSVVAEDQCHNYSKAVAASGCPATAWIDHPVVDTAINSGVRLPVDHPLTDPLLRAYMPASHPNIDKQLAAGTRLPAGHPAVDAYLCRDATLRTNPNIKLCPAHPDVSSTLSASTAAYSLPTVHPTVQPQLSPALPAGKCNVHCSLRILVLCTTVE